MSTQEFCLRWNNHQSTVMSVIGSLLQREYLVDVTLASEGKMLRAHRLVLSACSVYFEEMLSQQVDKHAIIFMKDVRFDELKALVDYMYTGEVSVAQDQLTPFLRTAEALKIKGLADKDDRGPRTQNLPREEPLSPAAELQLPAAAQTSNTEHSSAPPSARKPPPKKKRRIATPAAVPKRPLSYASEAELDNENFIAVPNNTLTHKVEPQEAASSQATPNQWESSANEGTGSFPVVSESYSLEANYATPEETIRPTKKTPAASTTKNTNSARKSASGGGVAMQKCDRCGGAFRSREAFKRHVISQCRIYPKTRYTCSVCPYSTDRKYNLRTHLHRRHKLTYVLCDDL